VKSRILISLVLLITATSVLVGNSCGPYTFTPNLPGYIKTVAIPLFKNPRTFKYGAERVITDAVIDEFIADGTLDVVDEYDADSKLIGEIVSYKKEALSYDVHELVQEYNLAVVVSITFQDARSGEVIWQEKSMYEAVSYFTVETSKGPAETEDEALERLAEELARKIVNRTMQGW
jgi:hypothetical protein